MYTFEKAAILTERLWGDFWNWFPVACWGLVALAATQFYPAQPRPGPRPGPDHWAVRLADRHPWLARLGLVEPTKPVNSHQVNLTFQPEEVFSMEEKKY